MVLVWQLIRHLGKLWFENWIYICDCLILYLWCDSSFRFYCILHSSTFRYLNIDLIVHYLSIAFKLLLINKIDINLYIIHSMFIINGKKWVKITKTNRFKMKRNMLLRFSLQFPFFFLFVEFSFVLFWVFKRVLPSLKYILFSIS